MRSEPHFDQLQPTSFVLDRKYEEILPSVAARYWISGTFPFAIGTHEVTNPSTNSVQFCHGMMRNNRVKAPTSAQNPPPKQFAYGLVGSDVEAPNFDPLQLSAGVSPETMDWYRAAELKVMRCGQKQSDQR